MAAPAMTRRHAPICPTRKCFSTPSSAAGIPKDDPALKKALIFVSRCQNLKGEHNDQPWAGKINDGSFIYSAANGGSTKSDKLPDGGLVGYGSMTYAGDEEHDLLRCFQGRSAHSKGLRLDCKALHARQQPRHAQGSC